MHKLKILNTQFVTHNVKRFVLEKPEDFIYQPGQSGHFSIDKEGLANEVRPFTFTSLNDWPYLELIVKIYNDRKGVTYEMGKLKTGDYMILHDIFGTIRYRGPGIFIAGGTGITPFISIFRALYYSGNLRNIGLIYSNHSREDIILGPELFQMLGAAYLNVFTQEGVIGFKERRIDRDFLAQTIQNFDQRFYVCGPIGFTEDVTETLVSLGASPQALII